MKSRRASPSLAFEPRWIVLSLTPVVNVNENLLEARRVVDHSHCPSLTSMLLRTDAIFKIRFEKSGPHLSVVDGVEVVGLIPDVTRAWKVSSTTLAAP